MEKVAEEQQELTAFRFDPKDAFRFVLATKQEEQQRCTCPDFPGLRFLMMCVNKLDGQTPCLLVRVLAVHC